MWSAASVACALAAGTPRARAQATPGWLPDVSGYVQVRYTDSDAQPGDVAIRRLKLMFDGGPAERLRYHVQLIYKTNNASSTDDEVFVQDAFLLAAIRGIHLKAGQFVPPFGLERSQPDYALPLVERTDLTNRMVINGNVGTSFARDRGAEVDWERGRWGVSSGVFAGGGANMPTHGNGPLGTMRFVYTGRESSVRGASWRLGLALATRHAADLDLSAAFPLAGDTSLVHFRGDDHRTDLFAEARWARWRGQAEFFRVWLQPEGSRERTPAGAYAQLAYLPTENLTVAARYEAFRPDLHTAGEPARQQWTAGVVYDLPCLHARLAADFTHPTTSWPNGPGDVLRVQVQWFFLPLSSASSVHARGGPT